ncbi:hypothetical protein PHK61_02095 [Actinomycetospora lutea]|uniref:hypothetical protein n=1 Tax=Actinomycetospora lutea TaxID=663604 RepID=UPI002366456E|nr:hypothetical protein [Actinomycetospora lutea]MDD7937206.1 hypothetical protein [Actinomycetospora lutea]
MHLHHAVVEAEVLLTRIERGEIETGWDAAGGWDVRRQQLLVDTVLREWPLPAIVLAGGDESDVLLDGRERLRALWRFVHDELPVGGTASADGEYLEQLDGLTYSQLPERFRRRVRRHGVLVVRVPGHAEGEVRELVARWDPTTPAFRAPSAAPPTPSSAPAITPPETVPPPPATPPLPAAREPGESFRPAVPEVPASPASEQATGAHRRAAASEPIFDELSAWFLEESGPPDSSGWSSIADPAHEAARSALRESTVELTPAGLPIRQPAARLAPGGIQAPAQARPAPTPDARAVGEHLNRFREGASAARHDLSPPA